MYISDGRNIRVITPDGKIQTLIGNHGRVTGPPRPIPCLQGDKRHGETLLAGDTKLQWPTRLAIDPLDSTLHIVDDSVILRVTPDMRIQVVAGVSPLCPILKHGKILLSRRHLMINKNFNAFLILLHFINLECQCFNSLHDFTLTLKKQLKSLN